ncbi:MAG: PilZ domain-containing protein [Polyangiaceae bacterium]
MNPSPLLTSEQRAHPRVGFDAIAVLSIQGSRIGDYRVRDLSAGGAFVTGGSVPPVGAPVDVLIKADQFGVISLRADVVRCATHADGAGVGLRFRPAPTHIEDMIVDAVLGELRKARRVVAA